MRKEGLVLGTAVRAVGAGDRGRYRVRTDADCSHGVLHKSLATQTMLSTFARQCICGSQA